jgi:hypothetical protein
MHDPFALLKGRPYDYEGTASLLFFAFELQVFFVLYADLDEVLALELAGEHRLGERILDVVLDGPP